MSYGIKIRPLGRVDSRTNLCSYGTGRPLNSMGFCCSQGMEFDSGKIFSRTAKDPSREEIRSDKYMWEPQYLNLDIFNPPLQLPVIKCFNFQ